MRLYQVWTLSGLLPHIAREGSIYTLCGREHMGFRLPRSGASVPRYIRSRAGITCKVCVKEAQRHDHKQDR